MATSKRSSPSSRGLGWAHRQQRDKLLRQHMDGAPCPCTECGAGCPCRAAGLLPGSGLPMFRDPAWNVDGLALEADHTVPRAAGSTALADRLMLATCNRSTGGAWRTAQASARDGQRTYGGSSRSPEECLRKKYWSREW